MTRVVDSRTPEDCARKVGWLAAKVRGLLRAGADYRVRQRACIACGKRCVSVELLVEDLPEVEASEG
jgi:hypothetical protein